MDDVFVIKRLVKKADVVNGDEYIWVIQIRGNSRTLKFRPYPKNLDYCTLPFYTFDDTDQSNVKLARVHIKDNTGRSIIVYIKEDLEVYTVKNNSEFYGLEDIHQFAISINSEVIHLFDLN